MALVELTQVKAILGLTGSADDTRLQAILNSVLSTITQLVGDLAYSEKTINVLNSAVKGNTLGLHHKNIVSLKTINGNSFTSKVNGTDYKIRNDGTVEVLDLQSFIGNKFGTFDVVYFSGWAKTPTNEVPLDFVQIVSELVASEFSSDLGRNVLSEKTGPRSVEYADTSRGVGGTAIDSAKTQRGIIKSRLRKYLPSHLRIW